MRSRAGLIPVLLFLCVVAAYFFYPTDENRLRKVLGNSKKAIISEEIDALMSYISFNYADDFGNNYLMLKKRLQSVFKRFNGIEIEMGIVKISIRDKKAESELSVRVIASGSGGNESDKGYIIGDAGEAAAIKVYFEKSLNKWTITGAEGLHKTVMY